MSTLKKSKKKPMESSYVLPPGAKLCECGPESCNTPLSPDTDISFLIPDYVSVIGKKFQVIQVDKSDLDTLEDESDGECEYAQQTIKIRMGRAPDCVKDTLLHECIHAIEDSLNLELTENQVARLATGLIGLFNDNPALKELLLNT